MGGGGGTPTTDKSRLIKIIKHTKRALTVTNNAISKKLTKFISGKRNFGKRCPNGIKTSKYSKNHLKNLHDIQWMMHKTLQIFQEHKTVTFEAAIQGASFKREKCPDRDIENANHYTHQYNHLNNVHGLFLDIVNGKVLLGPPKL